MPLALVKLWFTSQRGGDQAPEAQRWQPRVAKP